eukprot:787813-Rhodomonas_salina.5
MRSLASAGGVFAGEASCEAPPGLGTVIVMCSLASLRPLSTTATCCGMRVLPLLGGWVPLSAALPWLVE